MSAADVPDRTGDPRPLPPPTSRRLGSRLLFGAAVLALFAWLALRSPGGEDARLVMREFESMGTVVSVSVYRDRSQSPAEVEAAIDRVEQNLHAYEQRWAAWGGGALGEVNRALSAGESAPVPAELRPLFARAAQLTAHSGRRFDVRVGHLVEVWGFHDETQFRDRPPAAAAIDAALAALHAAPALDANTERYGPAPGVRLDFGAIAKGEAVDRALAQLRADGYPNAIVNAGGNLRAAGRRGDRGWRIGIRHPRPDAERRLLAMLEIDADEAVVTSGDYERYFEFEGRRYHHLLDPRSGQPARELQSVTIVAPGDAALADAASTALFVAGREWPAVARALDLDQVLVVDDRGEMFATPRLAPRLRGDEGLPAAVTVVTP